MASFDEFTLSQNLVGWTGAELEFLAEDSPVDIKPSFSSELIPLLGGNAVGPFRPPLSAKVPLWMAVQIKKARTGEIVCPEWLTVPYLDDWLLREQNSDQFCEPPCDHFIEVARVLITYAREDLGADIVLVEDRLRSVCEHRQAKIERGFQSLSDASDSIRVSGTHTRAVARRMQRTRGYAAPLCAPIVSADSPRPVLRAFRLLFAASLAVTCICVCSLLPR